MTTSHAIAAVAALAIAAELSRRGSQSKLSAEQRNQIGIDGRPINPNPYSMERPDFAGARDIVPDIDQLTWRVEPESTDHLTSLKLMLIEPDSPDTRGRGKRQKIWAYLGLRVEAFYHPDCRPLLHQLKSEGFGSDAMVWSAPRSWMDKRLHGRGLGTELYLNAIAAALAWSADDEAIFINDKCGGGSTSDEAQRVWDSLIRRFGGIKEGNFTLIGASTDDREMSELHKKWAGEIKF